MVQYISERFLVSTPQHARVTLAHTVHITWNFPEVWKHLSVGCGATSKPMPAAGVAHKPQAACIELGFRGASQIEWQRTAIDCC